jgi:hypothetical protein
MRPSLAPVGNSRGQAHRFPKDKKPEHMRTGAARSQAGAQPCTEDGYDHEARRARHQCAIGWHMSSNEIARKQPGKQRVTAEDENNREQVAACDHCNRFQHRSTPNVVQHYAITQAFKLTTSATRFTLGSSILHPRTSSHTINTSSPRNVTNRNPRCAVG